MSKHSWRRTSPLKFMLIASWFVTLFCHIFQSHISVTYVCHMFLSHFPFTFVPKKCHTLFKQRQMYFFQNHYIQENYSACSVGSTSNCCDRVGAKLKEIGLMVFGPRSSVKECGLLDKVLYFKLNYQLQFKCNCLNNTKLVAANDRLFLIVMRLSLVPITSFSMA